MFFAYYDGGRVAKIGVGIIFFGVRRGDITFYPVFFEP